MTDRVLARERQAILEELTILDQSLKEHQKRFEVYQDVANEADDLMRETVAFFRASKDRHLFHSLGEAHAYLNKRTLTALYNNQDELSHRRRQLLSRLEEVDGRLKGIEKEVGKT